VTREPARRRERSGLLRALALSLGLHAAAAAAYGGYTLGGDAPPSFEVGGSYIALSLRGAAGGGAAGAPAPSAAPGERDPGLLEPAAAVPPAPVDAPAPDAVASAESAAAVLATAAPAIEALASGLTRRVAALVEASIANAARSAGRTPEALAAWSSSSAGSSTRGVSAMASGDSAGREGGEGGSGGERGRGDGGGLSGPGAGSGNLPPIYPEDERLAGHEGTAIVLAVCAASGAVESVSLESSSGYPALDEAALEAVRHWTFTPQIEDGVAVASEIKVPVRFRIDR